MAVACAGRTPPTRSDSWNAPAPLERAIATTCPPDQTANVPVSPDARESSSITAFAVSTSSRSSIAFAARLNSGRPIR